MFNLFFSFGGRIGRLQYFLTGLGSGVLIIVALVLGAFSIAWKQSPLGGIVAMIGLVVILAICALWSSLSLQVRRIRDIGWDPTIVIVVFTVAGVLVRLAASGTGHSAHLVAAPLSLAYSGILLFWPGRGARASLDVDAVFGGEMDIPLPTPTALPRPTPAAVRSPAPVAGAAPVARRPGGPVKTFGRRGLA